MVQASYAQGPNNPPPLHQVSNALASVSCAPAPAQNLEMFLGSPLQTEAHVDDPLHSNPLPLA